MGFTDKETQLHTVKFNFDNFSLIKTNSMNTYAMPKAYIKRAVILKHSKKISAITKKFTCTDLL